MITDEQRAKLDAHNAMLPRHLRLTVSMASNLVVLNRTAAVTGHDWVAGWHAGLCRGSLRALAERGLLDELESMYGLGAFYRLTAAGRRALAELGIPS